MDIMNEDCTVYKTMEYLSKKWTPLILLELYKGKSEMKRYSEIKRKMPEITPKVLSARLKELETQGIIIKKIDTTCFPIKCEYALTKSGKDFIRIIKNIKTWALQWKIDNKLCENLECKNCEL
jgi:DNA-binding HxlR family transcriptional regulator